MKITVYTKALSYCGQCETTKRALNRAGLDFDIVPIDLPENADALAAFKSRPEPLLSAPIVTVHDADGAEVAAWAGFRPDLLAGLA